MMLHLRYLLYVPSTGALHALGGNTRLESFKDSSGGLGTGIAEARLVTAACR